MRDGPVIDALREMLQLVRDVRRRQFDLVIDFHSFRETNLLTWLSNAPVRVGMKRYRAPYLGFCFNTPPVLEDKSLHVSEMFRKVIASLPAAATRGPTKSEEPALVLPNLSQAKAPTLVLYVDAPVPERIWPPERFAEVADFAIERWGVAVSVISSKEGAALATGVQKASRNGARISVFTEVTLPQLAGIIAPAQLFISNDTGPMHIGPALGVRTLGLFSVGYPEHFGPTGPNDRFLRGNPIDKIEVKEVIEKIEEMWTGEAQAR
jgi:ADP-heptose:LPS heptosyltransferase